MQGVYLKIYVLEKEHLHGVLACEWLLEAARKLGLPGGSAFRAMAGYGRHGAMHEDHFFELAGDLPVQVSFALSAEQADQFMAHLSTQAVKLCYVRIPAEMGSVGAGP
jgi:PII-like signaling protein